MSDSSSNSLSFRRLAALGGLALVVLVVVQLFLFGSQPTPEDPAQDVIDYLAEDNAAHKLGSLLGHYITIPAAIFIAGWVVCLRASDRARDEGWAIVALIGGLVIAAAGGTGDAVLGGLFLREGAGLDPAAAQGLYDTQWVAYASGGAGMALLVGSAVVPAFAHRLFPAWFAWLSGAVVVLTLVGTLATVSRSGGQALGLIGFTPFLIWVVAASWLLYSAADSQDAATATPTPA